jgi:hypothetical protein
VPYIEGPKRSLKGGWTLSLSRTNAIEVQVNLDGRIHPKPAPYGDVWLWSLTCPFSVGAWKFKGVGHQGRLFRPSSLT